MEDPEKLWEALARARIVANPQKFRDYVLVPGHSSGKSHIFLRTLGYRPRSNADAWESAREFEEQALERVATGDVQFAGTISYGVRCTIVITVRGKALRTGWLLSEDVLRLITPFSGFAPSNPKG